MESNSQIPLNDLAKELADSIDENALFEDCTDRPSPEPYIPEEKRVWTGTELWNMKVQDADNFVEPIFVRVGLVSVYGGSDTGKSMYLLQLALDTVSGSENHIGFALKPRHHSVLMLCAEDSEYDLNFRIKKKAIGLTEDQLNNLTVIVSPEDGVKEAEEQLLQKQFDVIIVDPWGDVSGIDPSDNGKVRGVLKAWSQLAYRYKCLVVFLHHTGKTTDNKPPSKHNALGAQSFEAKMRCFIELRKDTENDALRHFCIVKANGLSQSFKTESFVLHFDPETFQFTNTGERRPFDDLVVSRPRPKEDDSIEKYQKAVRLEAEGASQDSIARVIGYANKGGVSKLLKRGKAQGWPSTQE
ncbi:AAA family ATPase [Dyadobacter tibetensis]|uniref:AAA family ATPase n=1 Tax=Dyadobacter tibetensis TaxID=1211851 RepID=UPI000472114F|nr:AAA family ATPase [Dyadobacter tibetensis]